MKVAALDLGSNTFLCLIAEVLEGTISKVYSDKVEIVRLAQGLASSKKFHPEALVRADLCLREFSKVIAQHRPDRVLAMATSAARDAVNKEALFEIAKKYGIPLEIIPGESEAQITYLGAVSGLSENDKNRMVVDVGGGSTEFIIGKGKKIIKGNSFDIGCVRLTEKLITAQPTSDAEVRAVKTKVNTEINKAIALMPKNFILDQIIAVAGTPTTLAAAELGIFDPQKIDGFLLSREKLNDWLVKLAGATIKEKVNMGIPSGRADVILVGVIILLQTLSLFGFEQLTVSTRGVRYGVALELGRRYMSGE